MTTEDPLQPVNIVKRGSRYSVVFAGGSQRFIKKTDLEKWKAQVDDYWASNPSKVGRQDTDETEASSPPPKARRRRKVDESEAAGSDGTAPGAKVDEHDDDDRRDAEPDEDVGCETKPATACVKVCVTCPPTRCTCGETTSPSPSTRVEVETNADGAGEQFSGEQFSGEQSDAKHEADDFKNVEPTNEEHTNKEKPEELREEEAEMAGAKRADEVRAERGQQGSLTTTKGTTSTSLRMKGRAELDYGAKDLGWILRGFVEHARGCGPDPHEMFKDDEACTDDRTPHQEKLMEMGRELFDALPAATSFFDVTSDEWHGWFRRSGTERCAVPMKDASTSASESAPSSASNSGSKYGSPTKWLDDPNPVGPPVPNQRAPNQTGEAWTNSGAWMAPVNGPITSRFGHKRQNGDVHEGIDIGAAVGTLVVAPQTMQVAKVGFSERAGRYVVANVMRPDGIFDDGDGYRLTFAHLSEVNVEEDAVVRRGQGFARSGATGKVTGPHLHFRAQWVEDGVLSDNVISIDPLAVIPEAVFAGQVGPVEMGARQAVGIRQGQPINIVIAPGAGRVSAGGKGVMQPDVGIQLPLLGEEVVFRGQPGGVDRLAGRAQEPDPLAGIVTALFDEAPDVIRGVGDFAQGVGQLASIGGTLASFIPGAAPIALPVASIGGAVGAAAQPVAQVGAGALEFGGRVLANVDPLDDII